MNQNLENISVALDALATAVTNAWGADNTIAENFGWYAPAVTRHDLADLAKKLAVDIRQTEADSIEPETLKIVIDIPRRLQILQSSTVPQMFGGNGGQAIPAYISTISIIRASLLPAIGWQIIPDQRSLPSSLARRVRAAQAELDQLTPNLEKLTKQIEDIQSAHKVADSLPVDLQTLSEARDKVGKSTIDVALNEEKIKKAFEQSSIYLELTKENNAEAKKLIGLCEAAYQITTTKGLAAAFDQRAGKLAWSMWTWVAGLIVALGTGSYIGARRLDILSMALQAPNPNWGGIAIQAFLSLLSVGAPLWFAWLATKQIGQRFRLAEDYAFKASVAKAYEGYRKEAARIDPAFEHRLFGSALDRLDEAPLRLVETGTHGSPWHELANSDAARKAFQAAPELRDKVTDMIRDGISATANTISKREPQPKISDVKPS